MLTLQFVPYGDIEHLDSQGRITKLLDIVRDDKIVLMQGRLRPEEETLLIQRTMEQIADEFKGVEICTIFPQEKDLQFLKRIKKEMIKAILGNRDGITIIGPANIVKEIKRDINKIELFTKAAITRPSNVKVKRRTQKRTTRRKRAKSQRRRR